MADRRNLEVVLVGRDASASKTIGKFSSNAQRSVSQLGNAGKLVSTGLAVAAGVAAAQVLKIGIAYQNSLNTFQAVSGASAAQMDQVGAKAKELGNNLSLPATSAADAAEAMTELAKGGLSVQDSMDAALGTLQLAAAAQVDGATAAQIQSSALNQFQLAARDAGHVADVLANTSNAASGEITDMANALVYVGPIANSMGISIDHTSTAIGLLAKNGIIGSQAGTALRGALAGLAAPSAKAAAAMDRLGVTAFDQQGNFVGLDEITRQLAKAKKNLTVQEFNSAAAMAFGREPLSAINALATAGVPEFNKMADAVGREGGAAEVAAARSKGLGGALAGLQSQAETVAISLFEKLSPGLESAAHLASATLFPAIGLVVDVLGTAVDVITATTGFLSDHEEILVVVAALYAAKMAPAIHATVKNFEMMARANVAATLLSIKGGAEGATTSLKGMATASSVATGAAAFGVGLLFEQHVRLRAEQKRGREEIDRLNGSIDKNSIASLKAAAAQEKLHTETSKQDFLLHYVNMNKLNDATDDMIAKTDQLAREFGMSRKELLKMATAAGVDLSGSLDVAETKLGAYYAKSIEASPATEKLAAAQEVLADKAAEATDQVDALKDAFDALIGVHLDAIEAVSNFESAIDAMTKSVKENGRTLDLNTEKGRSNMDALIGISESAQGVITSMSEEGATAKELNRTWDDQIAKFEKVASNAGFTKKQIHALEWELGLTKDTLQQVVGQTGLAAEKTRNYANSVKGLRHQLNRLPTRVDVAIVEAHITKSGRFDQALNNVPARAKGGPVLPGYSYTVGEDGMELLTMTSRGGFVTPLDNQSAPRQQMDASSGGGDDLAGLLRAILGAIQQNPAQFARVLDGTGAKASHRDRAGV